MKQRHTIRLGCLVLALVVVGFARSDAQDPENTRLLADPAVSKSHLAFVYDGGLWICGRDGSAPYRLTSHEGSETSPRFSPDGQSIAYSAEYDGNTDVYLLPIRGGVPKRLTYHPAADYVEGFTPDGTQVLFSSTRDTFTNRYRRLFTVSIEGGFPTPLPIPNGLRATYRGDGQKIAYIPIAERFNEWKNYRGGTTSRIWIYDTGDHSVQQVRQIEGRCNDTDPVFIGDRVYFRSDRDGEFNLFAFDPVTEAVERLTNYDDFPILSLSSDGNTIVFEQSGYLHLFDPATKSVQTLKIGLASDLTELRPRMVKGAKWIRSGDISPNGKRAVFEFRGEIVTVPAAKGDPRNLTESTGAHERSPAWSPDGKQIAFFSDADGEYRLHVVPQDGKGESHVYTLEGHGFFEEPKWSPDGKKISYRDNSWSLYVFDIERNRSSLVCSEPQYGPASVRGLYHSWSPDSKWLAYTVNTHALIQQAFVYNVEQATSHAITDGLSEVSEPVFDASGKYLYFLASTDAGPVKHWFAMSNNDMELSNQIYLAVLKNSGENPLARQSDEETAGGPSAADGKASESKKNADGKSDESSKTPTVEIDFDGIDQRIVCLPLPEAVYANLLPGTTGNIFYIKRNRDGESQLATYSLEKREATTLLEGARGFSITPDGKKLLYSTGSGYGIADAGGKIAAGSTALDVDKIEVRIDPRAEWQQIFEEVWRINRDYFYDPNMHGADWPAMKEKYRPLLEHCVRRSDLNRVLMWMCSELAVGHHRVGGGDERQSIERVPGGLLGADFSIDQGHYRFAKVYGGLNWNGQMRAPLTEPGVRVSAGEYLLAVNGEPLDASDNVYRRFENTAGKIVEITVAPSVDGKDARTVKVVPIDDDGALRNRDWVEGNLKKVQDATGGRVAYVYVPNTTNAGHAYFKRYFFPQTDRQAIIVDERFNGGGQVADYYIDHLRRPYISHWATRYGRDLITPSGAIFGPKVMLIDETAGSGGDLLPWMFHKLQIGTLVGKRTWGGLVGILGFPVLMDGGMVTAPNLAIWTEDGFVVENEGVPPDIEVEQWPADVIAGRDPQLEKAIDVALKQLEANPPKQYTKPPYPIRARQGK